MPDFPICPRCGHHIPTDQQPGEYGGARSRGGTGKEICSPCGTEEAVLKQTGFDLRTEVWPVTVIDRR